MPRYSPQAVESVKAHYLQNHIDDQYRQEIPVEFRFPYIEKNESYFSFLSNISVQVFVRTPPV